MEGKNIDTRGGSRPGAGRPRGIKRPYKAFSIKLPVEYIERIKDKAERHGLSVSKLIQDAIDRYDSKQG